MKSKFKVGDRIIMVKQLIPNEYRARRGDKGYIFSRSLLVEDCYKVRFERGFIETVESVEIKKYIERRGRPKGSKNKPKETVNWNPEPKWLFNIEETQLDRIERKLDQLLERKGMVWEK
jgi:hypothetical protein